MTVNITADPYRWYAIRCTSGREAKIIEAIQALAKRDARDIEPYMPAVTRMRRIRISRKKVIQEKFDRALFPGIVFIRAVVSPGAIEEIDGVRFYTRRDASGDNVPAILPAAGIEAIRRLQDAGEFDETKPKDAYTPKAGDKAFIDDGAWVSQIGEILKIKTSQGTATLIIDGRRVKAQLKTLRPEPKEDVAA